MSLDRRSIEKRDFPARLRGYDRAAVDAHLRWIADELDARIGSTADAAAEQVRGVLAAAQESAAQIVARAEADAQRIGSVAGRAGDEEAARVSAAASGALERLEALRGELTGLLDALGRAPAATADPSPATSAPVPDEPSAPTDEAGARIVALELALNGTPREQAEHVLVEQFSLGEERAALLDDVYAAAGRP